MSDFALGISVGLSSCCFVRWQCNSPLFTLPSDTLENTSPLALAFPSSPSLRDKESLLTGYAALSHAMRKPQQSVSQFTGLVGCKYDDAWVDELRRAIPHLEEQVMSSEDGVGSAQLLVQGGGGESSGVCPVEALSACIGARLRWSLSEEERGGVVEAVVTVPVFYNDAQRQAIKDAAVIGGVKPMRVINEPTAACLAYELDRDGPASMEHEQHGVVVDFGGAMVCVTQMSIDDGVFEVRHSARRLIGGYHIDRALADHCKTYRDRRHGGVAPALSGVEEARLLRACKVAKEALSCSRKHVMELDNFGGCECFSMDVSRTALERCCGALVPRIQDVLEECFKDGGGVSRGELSFCVLSGGSCRAPWVKSLVRKCFPGVRVLDSIPPEEVCARGAAIQASKLSSAGQWIEQVKEVIVSPVSLSIGLCNGNCHVVMERGSTLPFHKSFAFNVSPVTANGVDIVVYEGESRLARRNRYVGSVRMGGIGNDGKHRLGHARVHIDVLVDSQGIIRLQASPESSSFSKSSNAFAGHTQCRSSGVEVTFAPSRRLRSNGDGLKTLIDDGDDDEEVDALNDGSFGNLCDSPSIVEEAEMSDAKSRLQALCQVLTNVTRALAARGGGGAHHPHHHDGGKETYALQETILECLDEGKASLRRPYGCHTEAAKNYTSTRERISAIAMEVLSRTKRMCDPRCVGGGGVGGVGAYMPLRIDVSKRNSSPPMDCGDAVVGGADSIAAFQDVWDSPSHDDGPRIDEVD